MNQSTMVVDIEQAWYGQLSTADLLKLRETTPGAVVIRNRQHWQEIWECLSIGQASDAELPTIDFSKQSVVVVRNVRYLNRIMNVSADRTDGVLQVAARKTRSARPIGDTVYVAIFVVKAGGFEQVQLN